MDGEIYTYVRVIVALVFVLGLIVVLSAAAKKTGLDKKLMGSSGTAKIKVLETAYLDPKNKLMLVRYDGKEHLILLGASGNVLIESRESGEKM